MAISGVRCPVADCPLRAVGQSLLVADTEQPGMSECPCERRVSLILYWQYRSFGFEPVVTEYEKEQEVRV